MRIALWLLAWLVGMDTPGATPMPESTRATAAAERVFPGLRDAMARIGSAPGDPVFIRIFKQEAQLELWLQPSGRGDYRLFRSYPICRYSGRLGPKTREGDLQAPEGVYTVGPGQLNPSSQYHLSFNLGFPNAFEHAQGWTGSLLMIHGSCVSVGCFAMTDAGIEEIYTLVAAALRQGLRTVPVHSFPFRMDATALAAHADSPHHAFWSQLAEVYAAFETRPVPPRVRVGAGGYRVME